MPSISVIIPVWNALEDVKLCLASVVNKLNVKSEKRIQSFKILIKKNRRAVMFAGYNEKFVVTDHNIKYIKN